MASSSSCSPPITYRERVYVRHATLWCRRNEKNVTRSVIDAAITEANGDDARAATTAKYFAAKNTVKHVYARASNKYFFVPSSFGSKVVRGVVTGGALKDLIEYLEHIEASAEALNMNTTLLGSNSALWFLDKDEAAVSNTSKIVTDTYLGFETSERACDVFRDFVDAGKVPSLVSYLLYEVGKKCGLPNHQDVDATFFSALLMIQDTTRGRLHIDGMDLPEEFNAGDLIFMDPRVYHSVENYARETKRKVVVYTV